MAGIDYAGIEDAIKAILQADDLTRDANILVEEEFAYGSEQTPAILIFLDRRTAPPNEQPLAAGTRTRMNLQFSIWCAAYSLESIALARSECFGLIANTEIVLMKNRTLSGTVETSWLEGGDLSNFQSENSFLSMAEIEFTAQVTAQTQ